MQNKGGFLAMVFAVLGIVLYCSFFTSIQTGLVTLLTYANISTFPLFLIMVKIAPVVLLLGGLLGSGAVYFKGFQKLAANGGDVNGLLRMVMAALGIVLFVTMFSTILDSFYTLYTSANASSFIAFQIVTQIMPALLFIIGVGGFVATGVSGLRARKNRKSLA